MEDTGLIAVDPGWLGVLLGLLGVLFGLYQLIRRTGARLVFQYGGERLIEGSGGLLPKEVVVLYESNPVPRLSVTYLVIWNSGHSPIRGEDIVPDDQIRFWFGRDADILQCEVLKVTREANRAELIQGPEGSVLFRFQFLDKGDGLSARILHTGRNRRPVVFGTIVGLPNGMESLGIIPFQFISPRNRQLPGTGDGAARIVSLMLVTRKPVFALAAIIGLAGLVISIFPEVVAPVIELTNYPARITLGGVAGVYAVLGLWTLWLERRRFPASLALEQQEESASLPHEQQREPYPRAPNP